MAGKVEQRCHAFAERDDVRGIPDGKQLVVAPQVRWAGRELCRREGRRGSGQVVTREQRRAQG